MVGCPQVETRGYDEPSSQEDLDTVMKCRGI